MTFTAARHKIAAYPSFPDVNRGIKQHRYILIFTKHDSVSFGETPRCWVPTASGTETVSLVTVVVSDYVGLLMVILVLRSFGALVNRLVEVTGSGRQEVAVV
jgi:hypothetical protein